MKPSDIAKPEDPQLLHLRKRNKQLEDEIERLNERMGEGKELKAAILAAVEAAEPPTLLDYKTASGKGEKPVVPVLNLGDWHNGAVVKADRVEGINAFNPEILQKRIDFVTDKFIEWVDTQRGVYQIDELQVFGLADMISGGIHHELLTTNAYAEPVQAVRAGYLLGATLCKLAQHFKAVRYDGVSIDNHSRLTKKNQFADGDSNSWQFVVHAVAEAYTRNVPNLGFNTIKGIKGIVKVAGHNLLIEHGHTNKSWAGLPFYGLARSRGKEATRRMRLMLQEARESRQREKKEYGFDYQQIGHYHTPCLIEGDTLINSSPQGTTEFDHAFGRFGRAGQTSYLMHPKHGLFSFTMWNCE